MHGGQRCGHHAGAQTAAGQGRLDERRQRLHRAAEARVNGKQTQAALPDRREALEAEPDQEKRELKRAKRWEHTKASLRAKVEYPFRVIKRQFGYVNVRYRGLAKNTAQVLTLLALSNLWLKRKQLMPMVGKMCL